MNITAPTSGGPWPIVVELPGGPQGLQFGFQFYMQSHATLLASQGAVVIESWWRQQDFVGSGYPAAFADVACAIGVARKIGPDYGASPGRVTLVGHSLGGWPAAVVGLTPKPFTPTPGSCDPTAGSLRPDGVVILSGAVDLQENVKCAGLYTQTFLGGDRKALPDVWAAVDPLALPKRYPARAGAIPYAIVQDGKGDCPAAATARRFEAALVAAGYKSRLAELPTASHESMLSFMETLDTIMGIAGGR